MSLFRSRLLLDEQKRLYDLWLAASINGQAPTKRDIQPRFLGGLLPFISLTERNGQDLVLRMAGSQLRETLRSDPKAILASNACPSGQAAALRVLETGKPMAGSVDALRASGPTKRHWLRLPLTTHAGGEIDAVLGLDVVAQGQVGIDLRFAPTSQLWQLGQGSGEYSIVA